MNLILSENEQKIKEWNFVDKSKGLTFQNDVIVTEKRFIFQKELVNSSTQRYVKRLDVGISDIKAVDTFYGSKQNKLWLIVGIIGILVVFLSILMLITEEIEMGISMCIFGLILSVVGFFFHTHPEKSLIKVKKPSFTIKLETKTPVGSKYLVGAGQDVVLKGKWRTIFNILRNDSDGLEMPEEVAKEVIETLGAIIF